MLSLITNRRCVNRNLDTNLLPFRAQTPDVVDGVARIPIIMSDRLQGAHASSRTSAIAPSSIGNSANALPFSRMEGYGVA